MVIQMLLNGLPGTVRMATILPANSHDWEALNRSPQHQL